MGRRRTAARAPSGTSGRSRRRAKPRRSRHPTRCGGGRRRECRAGSRGSSARAPPRAASAALRGNRSPRMATHRAALHAAPSEIDVEGARTSRTSCAADPSRRFDAGPRWTRRSRKIAYSAPRRGDRAPAARECPRHLRRARLRPRDHARRVAREHLVHEERDRHDGPQDRDRPRDSRGARAGSRGAPSAGSRDPTSFRARTARPAPRASASASRSSHTRLTSSAHTGCARYPRTYGWCTWKKR